ncbi:MAG: hypothetical protein QOJ79_1276 [Actinomycetota bacterium]|jgi:hypothetical protein|nr:hypothetical protein [Actinomycetota bacterium]
MTAPDRTASDRAAGGFEAERYLAIASAVLLPLGLAVIVLGWYGAAHTPYLFEQVPYLISGGLLGLGLAVVGGLVYFGSWVARGAAEQRRQNEEVAGLLREIREDLRGGVGAAAPPARRTASGNGRGPYVATAKGGMLHRPDCAVVAGRDDLRSVSSTGDGLAACGLCNPFDSDVLSADLT